MVDLDHMDPENMKSALALLTMLSKNVYAAMAGWNMPEDGIIRGFNMKQVMALSYLRQMGPLGQGHFGQMVCMDANNTVLLLNGREADGLAVRRRDPEDRRRHVIEPTPAGLEMLAAAEAAMADVEDDLLAALDDEQRRQLRALLGQALYGEGGVLARKLTDQRSASVSTP